MAAIRIALVVMGSPAPLTPDAHGYLDAGSRLAQDRYFAYVNPYVELDTEPSPNATSLPGYPAFIAFAKVLSGDSLDVVTTVRIMQAIISSLTIWAIFSIASTVGAPRSALMAALIAASYVPMWWSYNNALTEELFMCLISYAMLALLRASTSRTRRQALLLSVTVGIIASAALYVRAAAAPWLLVSGVVLLVFDRGHRRRHLLCGAVVAIIVVSLFTPWWVRNFDIYGSFVPLSTGGQTGSLIATFDDWKDLSAIEPYFLEGPLSPKEEVEQDRRIAKAANERLMAQLREDPWKVVFKRVRAIVISIATYDPNPYGGFSGMGGVVLLQHLTVVGLAVIGWIKARRSVAIALVAALPSSLLLFHSSTLIFSRYLFPAMPAVFVLAGLAFYPKSPGRPMCPRTADAAATAGLHR